ncbi:MAG TPA: hypothetical protein RMG45_20185, partial [Polyangiaceae bacterium LLY-WYZ-15_(1-7)]|nr:hypothetical protein [Polyangiaceae bacterium LLY-WYZ-15_(1-7)]
AERLAAGLGWTFVDGPATDGVTGPLWVLPAWLGAATGLGAPLVQKALGLAAAALGAGLVVARARGPEGARDGAVRLGAGLLVGLQSTLGVWGQAGLETGAAVLAAGLAAIGVGVPGRRGDLLLGGAVAALAGLRPEMAPFALVLLLARARPIAWGLAVGGVLAWLAFRLALFGAVLPLSYQAKVGAPGTGLPYVGAGLLLTTGVVGLGLAAVGARRPGRRAWGLAAAAQVGTVALVGGDWMPGARLLAPVLPLYGVLAAEGAAALWAGGRARRALAAVGLLGALALPLIDLVAQLGPVRAAGAARRAARGLAERLGEHESVALVDVGWLTWDQPVDVVDLGGLTDPTIARAPGGHLTKEIPIAYLAEREPEVILLHAAVPPRVDGEGRLETLAGYPVERGLAASGWVRANYRVEDVIRYAEGYHYVWLARRPPGPPGARDARESRRE